METEPSPICPPWLRPVLPMWLGFFFFRTLGHRWDNTTQYPSGGVEQQCKKCGEWRHDPKPKPHRDSDGSVIREAGPHYVWRTGRVHKLNQGTPCAKEN
jgi:hypothetical protein